MDPLVFGEPEPFRCLKVEGFLDEGLDLFFRNLLFSINFKFRFFIILKYYFFKGLITLTSKKLKLKFYFLKIITLSFLRKSFDIQTVVNFLSSKIFLTFLLWLLPTSTRRNPFFFK